jgi:hypothetical protein
VAVAVQVIGVPIFCGGVRDGLMDTIRTVAEAGTAKAASSPAKHNQ